MTHAECLCIAQTLAVCCVCVPSLCNAGSSAVSSGAAHMKLLLEQTQQIALQLGSDVPALAEALASLRRAYKEQ
jgi:hypothetical protein